MKTEFIVHVPSRWLKNPQKKEETFVSFQERYNDLSELEELRVKFPDYSVASVVGWLSENIGRAWLYCREQLTFNYLFYLNQLRLAWFQYTMNDSHPVTLNLVNRIISTTGKFENHRISASDVTEGIETALILRDENALAYLATIPVSFTEQSSQDDLILEIIMTFYQMLAKGKGNSNEAQATYHAISEQLDWETYKRYIKVEGFNQLWVWERIFTARKEYVEAISLPVITIYHQIFQASQAGFEDAVRLALHQWKTYYTRIRIDENQEEEDRTLWGQGFLSLPITAACAFGYERGLTLSSLESDYIPQWLIEGHFNGIDLLVK